MNTDTAHSDQIKRLERSTSESMVAGVAGGLGRYFDLNPAVFRLGFAILTLVGGVGVLAYLAAVLVIPLEGNERSLAADVLAQRRDRPWPVVGLGLAGVALVLLLSRARISSGAGWTVALVAGLAILWVSRGQKRARRVLLTVGTLATLAAIAVCAAVVIAFTWFDVNLSDGVGDRAYTPATATAVASSYALGVGDLKLDLSQITPAGSRRITAKVGVGELRIVVPSGARVRVDAHAKVGDVYVFRSHDDGRDARVRTGSGTLVIDATVGAGRIDVVRAS
jgi:phage shock protein PspC (stress-responsive transcriptional regulator)